MYIPSKTIWDSRLKSIHICNWKRMGFCQRKLVFCVAKETASTSPHLLVSLSYNGPIFSRMLDTKNVVTSGPAAMADTEIYTASWQESDSSWKSNRRPEGENWEVISASVSTKLQQILRCNFMFIFTLPLPGKNFVLRYY